MRKLLGDELPLQMQRCSLMSSSSVKIKLKYLCRLKVIEVLLRKLRDNVIR
jgi:hypothetical protein